MRLLSLKSDAEEDTFRRLDVIVAQGAGIQSTGKGASLSRRKASAAGEWLERLALVSAKPHRYSPMRALGPQAISPMEFGLDYPDERPAQTIPFDTSAEVGWFAARSLGSGQQRWLHRPGWHEAGFYRPTSNGAAVGRTQEATAERAVAELLERDAFLRWWYGFTAAIPLTCRTPEWQHVAEWLRRAKWRLHAYLLPSLCAYPIALAVATRVNAAGAPMASIIGLGTASGGEAATNQEDAATEAALEIVQALEGFRLAERTGIPPTGDLVRFLTPAGADTVVSKLLALGTSATAVDPDSLQPTACSAALEAGIDMWLVTYDIPALAKHGAHCVQAFSRDTLPFALTGKGRRLDHHVVDELLHTWGRDGTTIPPLPHPLG
ncbi:YcaO-like family protein [Nonomuraea sp. NPDC049758]|uniref:YcaO-like family protein n=1 Tax=Nonomuraea sp. NPDC049758 TaxID=3154360 RepID=UPI0034447836